MKHIAITILAAAAILTPSCGSTGSDNTTTTGAIDTMPEPQAVYDRDTALRLRDIILNGEQLSPEQTRQLIAQSDAILDLVQKELDNFDENTLPWNAAQIHDDALALVRSEPFVTLRQLIPCAMIEPDALPAATRCQYEEVLRRNDSVMERLASRLPDTHF